MRMATLVSLLLIVICGGILYASYLGVIPELDLPAPETEEAAAPVDEAEGLKIPTLSPEDAQLLSPAPDEGLTADDLKKAFNGAFNDFHKASILAYNIDNGRIVVKCSAAGLANELEANYKNSYYLAGEWKNNADSFQVACSNFVNNLLRTQEAIESVTVDLVSDKDKESLFMSMSDGVITYDITRSPWMWR